MRWYSLLVALLLFLLPSNLFLKFWEPTAYVHGLLSDYLLPRLYVSDIPIVMILFSWLWEKRRTGRTFILKYRVQFLITLSVIVIVGARQLFTPYPVAAIWYWLKILEMGSLGLFFATHRQVIKKPLIGLVIGITLATQSLLGIYQFYNQTSLAPYSVLGETVLKHQIGLAKGIFAGAELILPYGTTSHPNVLGGVIVLFLWLWWQRKPATKAVGWLGGWLALCCLSLFVLWLTQSLSAWITLASLVFISAVAKGDHFKKALALLAVAAFLLTPLIIASVFPFMPNNPSVFRRYYLQTASLNMIIQKPLLGVGFNNFTGVLEENGEVPGVVRFVQPVHHSGLLVLSEWGIGGVTLLLGFVFLWMKPAQLKNKPEYWLAAVALWPILSLDHYLLTGQTGLLLLTVWLVYGFEPLLGKTLNQSNNGRSKDRS